MRLREHVTLVGFLKDVHTLNQAVAGLLSVAVARGLCVGDFHLVEYFFATIYRFGIRGTMHAAVALMLMLTLWPTWSMSKLAISYWVSGILMVASVLADTLATVTRMAVDCNPSIIRVEGSQGSFWIFSYFYSGSRFSQYWWTYDKMFSFLFDYRAVW